MSLKKGMGIAPILLVSFSLYFFLPPSCPEPARRTAVIFMIAAFFWAFEIIPLYATSLLVVLLETLFLTKAGGICGIPQNHYALFLMPFANPIIILFMGGFVLAAALHKYEIDRLIAALLLKRFGNRPYFILLGFMTATAFLSMWMSNTATTALMLTMIFPLLAHLEPADSYRKALVLAIAFAANIGGIGTPVGTPPNAIALGMLAERGIYLNFISWMRMTLPLMVILLFLASLILYKLFPSKNARLEFPLIQEKSRKSGSMPVTLIAVFTVLLWLTSPWHKIPEAIVALLATVLLTAFGLLNQKDFQGIEWSILILMWGGLALGDGMEKTGLAHWLVGLPFFAHQGFGLIVIFCFLAVFISTFVSNTATVNLLVPLAVSFPNENPVVLAVIVALASSFDIPLPVATPPLAIVYGTHEVTVKEMLKGGVPIILAANLLLLLGIQWMAENILRITAP